jgi:hypothetical protein
MVEQAQSSKKAPAEASRTLLIRYRVCRYLFHTAGIWIVVGVVSFVAAFFSSEVNVAKLLVRGFESSEAIGVGVFTIALAVTFAIYRCPVCDAYLSPLRLDKFRCPACNTSLRPQSS